MHLSKQLSGFSFTFFSLFFCFTQLFGQFETHHLAAHQTIIINYLLYLPQDYHHNDTITFPMVVFLHGAGEGGDNIEKVKTHGIPELIAEGEQFPFMVLAPQNPSLDKFWDDQLLMDLIIKIENEYRVDENRIYLTGLSRGGYGVWRTAMNNPDKFAALIPLCGATPASPIYAQKLKDIPIWVFHGENDGVIPLSESESMVNQLEKVGANVKFTIMEGKGHDIWDDVYRLPELYEWIMKQQKSNE